jgi:hypothetical protein
MTPVPIMPQPTTPGFPSSTFAECGNTDYGSLDSANEDARLPFQSTFFFGDGVTTACTDLAPGQLCLFGEAVSSALGENMYANWGAGVGLVVAELDANGEVVAPFDATAQGISGFSLRVSQVAGRAVRVLFTEVDSPDVSDASKNFFANAFVWGGSVPMTVSTSGEIAVSFSEFALPNWTVIDESLGTAGDPLDPSRLHSLQLQISNSPADVEVPYSFCVSDLAWLDAGTVDPGPDVDELDGGADDDAGFGAR